MKFDRVSCTYRDGGADGGDHVGDEGFDLLHRSSLEESVAVVVAADFSDEEERIGHENSAL